jgi:hypothetical protein
MSLREGSREYYYDKLDLHFPGLRQQYESIYGSSYHLPCQNQKQLAKLFYELCDSYGLATRVSSYPPKNKHKQLTLF